MLAMQARTDAPPVWLREQVGRLVVAGYLEARDTDEGRQYRLTCGPEAEKSEIGRGNENANNDMDDAG